MCDSHSLQDFFFGSRTCTITTDQYVRNFYTGALARQPNATELQQWTTAIDQALAEGYGAVLGKVRDLGTTLFTSQEYLNRNRTNSEFIIDLYWGYLHRTYDQTGYDNWLATLNGGATREQVRQGFALSAEFENNAGAVCTVLGGISTVKYVFMDHQGSARTLLNGSGAVLARHDYLPFGEELWAGVGMRTSAQQYGAMDQNRARYALTQKDEATGLDHTWWRKYENSAGRWTSPDPLSGNIGNPQSFNRYTYVQNDPVNLIDPSGLLPCTIVFDPVTGEPTCVPDIVPPPVTVYPSELEEYVESRGADHGAYYGDLPNITMRALIAPQNTGQPDWLDDFYWQYQRKLARCVWKIFGKDANRLTRQTLRNAPRVNTTLTMSGLGRMAGRDAIIGYNNPRLGSHGTVYIASEVATSKDPTINPRNTFGTFVHELGNLLDAHLNPNSPAEQYQANYGNPNSYDPDTGQALEDCVFGP